MKKVSLDALPSVAISHTPDIHKKVMLGPGAAPGLTNFSQAILRQGHVAPGHVHEDMYEVFFVRRGAARVLVEGEVFDLESGACLMIEPGELHEVSNPHEEDLVLLYFGLLEPGREVEG
jgi:quercetin dioxygenase-like cupin family protein